MSSGDMAHISLLYAIEDRAFTDTVERSLRAAGHDVSRKEVDGHACLTIADDAAASTAPDAKIVFWSPASAASTALIAQARAALAKRILTSVSVDGTEPPASFQHLWSIDLSGWNGGSDDPHWRFVLDEINLCVRRSEIGFDEPESPVMGAGGRGGGGASAPAADDHRRDRAASEAGLRGRTVLLGAVLLTTAATLAAVGLAPYVIGEGASTRIVQTEPPQTRRSAFGSATPGRTGDDRPAEGSSPQDAVERARSPDVERARVDTLRDEAYRDVDGDVADIADAGLTQDAAPGAQDPAFDRFAERQSAIDAGRVDASPPDTMPDAISDPVSDPVSDLGPDAPSDADSGGDLIAERDGLSRDNGRTIDDLLRAVDGPGDGNGDGVGSDAPASAATRDADEAAVTPQSAPVAAIRDDGAAIDAGDEAAAAPEAIDGAEDDAAPEEPSPEEAILAALPPDPEDAGLAEPVVADTPNPVVVDAAALEGNLMRDCFDCPDMAEVPRGAFVMGSPTNENARAATDLVAKPRSLNYAFAISVREVTYDQWAACVADEWCKASAAKDPGWGRGERPVVNVSWRDAQDYVAWISYKTGYEYRLPTETEWEYAARAGADTPFDFGNRLTTDKANYNGRYQYQGPVGIYRRKTLPVGSFEPNAFGLYDMHGNVWEWVADCWSADGSTTMSEPPAVAPDPDACAQRVLKGGAWNTGGWRLRAGHRVPGGVDSREYDNGFRVARAL
ncbi:MAG: SUMF1/EgtB/PvdO family nonheme iron enzyme [Pseudomonadota bacterium]